MHVNVGFGGLLAIAFIVLKLCGVIGWSWWWVLSPLWIPLALIVVVVLAFAGAALGVEVVKDIARKRART